MSTQIKTDVFVLHNRIETADVEWLTVIAMVDNAPVGVADIEGWSLEIVQLQSFNVQPDYRGHGIGSAMLQRVIDEATAVGKHSIILDVERENGGAIRFYERFGFKITGHYLDKYWMTLTI